MKSEALFFQKILRFSKSKSGQKSNVSSISRGQILRNFFEKFLKKKSFENFWNFLNFWEVRRLKKKPIKVVFFDDFQNDALL